MTEPKPKRALDLLPPLDWRQKLTWKKVDQALADGKDPEPEDMQRLALRALVRLMYSRRPEDVRYAFRAMGLQLPKNGMTTIVADQRRMRERNTSAAPVRLTTPKS